MTTPEPSEQLSPQPEITYPTAWSYRIVGESESDLRAAIRQTLEEINRANHLPADYAHTIQSANQSATGKYISLNLELIVQSETHRHQIFDALSSNPQIRYVL